MNQTKPTVSDLLNSVEVNLGPERTLELIRNLGAHPTPLDSGAPPELGPLSQKSRVVIIGGGIAGLVLTYELAQRGIDVELWEASSRLGGRNFTVRPGDVIQENGHPDQICRLPEGGYLSAGPGRISHHHRAVLYYCRRFGLTLRPYQTLNRAALLQANPLSASDYPVGVIAWAFGCSLVIPTLGGFIAISLGMRTTLLYLIVGLLVVGSFLLGGFLGYLRCRAIASR